jgi:hypothetical protein
VIPNRAGGRVKTDRRVAASLAKLHRAGELTAVWVPNPAHEAIRDDLVRALRRASSRGFCCTRPAITGCRHGSGCIAGLFFRVAS